MSKRSATKAAKKSAK
jgi:hypothetical protein